MLFIKSRIRLYMTHLTQGLALEQVKVNLKCFVKGLFSLLFLGRKMFHPNQAAAGGADPRPRSLAYSCHLCVCCSFVWFGGVAGLCFHTSQL